MIAGPCKMIAGPCKVIASPCNVIEDPCYVIASPKLDPPAPFLVSFQVFLHSAHSEKCSEFVATTECRKKHVIKEL